jgi:hypothetical protein
MNRNLWHAITEQKNVHNGGAYAWMDTSESEVTVAAECILPSLSSYAGVILGLTAASMLAPALKVLTSLANSNSDHMQPTQALPSPSHPPFTIISSPVIVPVPQRCSRLLAVRAEQAGGRLVYHHTDAPRVFLR